MNNEFILSDNFPKQPLFQTKPLPLGKKDYDKYITCTADRFVFDMKLIRKYRDCLYMFDGRVYRPLNDSNFYNYAYYHALTEGVEFSPPQCRRLLSEVSIRTCETMVEPDSEEYTVFSNYIVSNFDGIPLMSYPGDYFPTIMVDANYLTEPVLYHPVTDSFLYTISGGDSELIARHWEFWGYVLSSDYHAKAIFSLFGESGNNGKSTELSLIQSFLPGAVDNMPIKTMISQFGRHRIQHCRFECSADEGAVNLDSEGIAFLKSASGADTMTANVKFKEMVSFTCKCKIAIASNYNIGMAYSSVDQAFLRRLVTIPYPYSIPKEQQDPFILQKLMCERDAIATEAFRHYLRLKANGYVFTGHERFDSLQSIYATPVNPEYMAVRDFSDRFCDFSDSGVFTSTQELYEVFQRNYSTNIIDATGFSQAFNFVNQGRVQNKRHHSSTQNVRGFLGVKLAGGNIATIIS